MANSHASGRRQTLSMSVSRFHTAQTNLMLNKKAFTTKKKLVKFNIIFFSSRSEQQAFSTFLASFTLLCNFTSITNWNVRKKVIPVSGERLARMSRKYNKSASIKHYQELKLCLLLRAVPVCGVYLIAAASDGSRIHPRASSKRESHAHLHSRYNRGNIIIIHNY